jgi:hypothetical protein
MEAARPSETLVSYRNTTQRHMHNISMIGDANGWVLEALCMFCNKLRDGMLTRLTTQELAVSGFAPFG